MEALLSVPRCAVGGMAGGGRAKLDGKMCRVQAGAPHVEGCSCFLRTVIFFNRPGFAVSLDLKRHAARHEGRLHRSQVSLGS